MIVRMAGVVLMVMMLGVGLFNQTQAQDATPTSSPAAIWSPPNRLGEGWWQSMATDREGNLHVAWYGMIRGGVTAASIQFDEDLLMYTQLPLDGSWLEAYNAVYAGCCAYTVRNAIATTADGMLYALYRTNSYFSIARSPIIGSSEVENWERMGPITDSGYYGDLIIDQSDVLHMVYSGQNPYNGLGAIPNGGAGTSSMEVNPCAIGCGDPLYLRSADGGQTWSLPVLLSVTPSTGSDKIRWMQGRSGRLYALWEEGVDWVTGRGSALDVRFVYSNDHGLSWSDPVSLTGGEEAPAAPIHFSLAELRDGSLLATWRYSTSQDLHIYYQISRDLGTTWTSPQAIPGIFARDLNESGLDTHQLIVDEFGTAHLFAVGYAEGVDQVRNPALYHVAFQQGLWLPPRRIFYSPTEQPEWPQAKIGHANDLHVTWFTRDIPETRSLGLTNLDRRQNFMVYYSHNQNLPIVRPTQAFEPTITPLPTTTPVVNLAPTVTPFPTVPADFSNVAVLNTDQYASQALLLAIAAVGTICAGVVFVMRIGRG
jgi:hypothetical protein